MLRVVRLVSIAACLWLITLAWKTSAQSSLQGGIISTIAGYGPSGACGRGGCPLSDGIDYGYEGYSGDGGPAISSALFDPNGIAVDAAGNIFIADTNNHRIRKITAAGIISTVAGTGNEGYSGDGGPATSASINFPWDVALDSEGNLFISDSDNHRIRRVALDGTISTVAGNGTAGYSGDGSAATMAEINAPRGVAVDNAGNLFFADLGQTNDIIRKVDTNGVISTVAGNGSRGFGGDGGPATSAMLNAPFGIAVDMTGNLFIADSGNSRIRKVTPNGLISTIAGNGANSNGGDGGAATTAGLAGPSGVTVDAMGNLFIADTFNGRIREVTPDGVISTIAGTSFVFSGAFGSIKGVLGDGGPATSGILDPNALAFDPQGNLLVVDGTPSRIRKVTFAPLQSVAYTSGVSLQTQGPLPNVTVGYAQVAPNSPSPVPSALAIFGFRNNNVLVSEASVPASDLIESGMVYAQSDGVINTGIALVNSGTQTQQVSFVFTDTTGVQVHTGKVTLPSKAKIATFLNQPPFNGPQPFSGTFTFTASAPVATIALRGLINERSDFLMTTVPVTPVSTGTVASATVIFPHFADGGGWTTELELVNPTSSSMTGSVQFLSPSGTPDAVTINGVRNSIFSYSLAAGSSQKLDTDGSPTSVATGSVRVLPSSSSGSPAGVSIFSFRNQGFTVAAAGVPAAATATAFRVYAESSATVETAIAVANDATSSATVTAELLNLDGSSTGMTGSLTIPGNGQTALFLNQIPGLTSLQGVFRGVLRLSSSSPISVIGLRGRYNERSDFLITTTTPAVEGVSPSAVLFPHIVDSGGYTTQFVLFGNAAGQLLNGSLQLFSFAGGPTSMLLQ